MAATKMLFAGFGGQGVLLIGQMIAYAALAEGKEVTWMPSYGPEMRGGTANCTVIVSDKPIASPIATDVDMLLAMNEPSLEKFADKVRPGGTLFVNGDLINEFECADDVNAFSVACTQLATEKFGNTKVANMIMLGAIVRKTGVVKLESIEAVMAEKFTGKKAALLDTNKQALRAWEE